MNTNKIKIIPSYTKIETIRNIIETEYTTLNEIHLIINELEKETGWNIEQLIGKFIDDKLTSFILTRKNPDILVNGLIKNNKIILKIKRTDKIVSIEIPVKIKK